MKVNLGYQHQMLKELAKSLSLFSLKRSLHRISTFSVKSALFDLFVCLDSDMGSLIHVFQTAC